MALSDIAFTTKAHVSFYAGLVLYLVYTAWILGTVRVLV
jgi:hypothetical protein